MNGYYVWGRNTSVAWFFNRKDAEECAKNLNYRGGTYYTVVSA
jgi:hypothetical protein